MPYYKQVQSQDEVRTVSYDDDEYRSHLPAAYGTQNWERYPQKGERKHPSRRPAPPDATLHRPLTFDGYCHAGRPLPEIEVNKSISVRLEELCANDDDVVNGPFVTRAISREVWHVRSYSANNLMTSYDVDIGPKGEINETQYHIACEKKVVTEVKGSASVVNHLQREATDWSKILRCYCHKHRYHAFDNGTDARGSLLMQLRCLVKIDLRAMPMVQHGFEPIDPARGMGKRDVNKFMQEHPVSVVLDAGHRRKIYAGDAKGANSEHFQSSVPLTNITSLCPTHHARGSCGVAHDHCRTTIDRRIDLNGTLNGTLPLEHLGDLYLKAQLRFFYEGIEQD